MSQPPHSIEQQRLVSRLESAGRHATDMNQRCVQISAEIAKEKTQYFEKIALAAGGTIALVVSFVGSHVGRLQPSWLLRSALIVLVLAMIAAMCRNWKYPFYLMAVYARQDYGAKRERERCRRDYIVAFPAVAMEDGKLIDVKGFLKGFAEDDEFLSGEIGKFQRQERSAFAIVKHVE
jgi:hypothetical protein